VGSPRQREIIGALLERFESGLPTVTSVILPPPDFPSHLLESRGYRISSHLTAVIDLDGTEEDAWRAIHPKTRNMISKARRCGVRVHVAGEESLHVLPSMVASAFARAGKEPPPAGFLMTVARILGRRGLAHVLTATRDDRPVAAAIFLYHRDRSYYWAGGASEEGYLTGASHLVQWEGIRAALENGCSLHDLVMVSPAQAPGIARFKIRFGARIVPLQTATRRSLVGRILGRVS
jgi:lipid II:glycine glycyltransferase (peptidoglycan interpeptide bridge formation enzyme)